ncbi:MAG: glycosyltransferase, partial [Rhodospirillales bacterium]|nr:glycosyltransferase [Rhodospirillales bacterium]
TGTMDYAPNVDAVTWFATDVLPLIRARLPDAQFHVVGAHPAPAVQALARRPSVHVTGRVADVRPYLAHAAVAVAPLRIARGIQNKVLEAMAMARPVVVTSGALEGIDAIPGRDLLLADAAEAFAAACCRLVERPDLAAALGAAARARVVAHYDWATCLAGFDDLLCPAEAA